MRSLKPIKTLGTRYSAFGTLLLFLVAGCSSSPLPEPGSAAYQEVVTTFYSSIASIQSGEDVGAEANLLQAAAVASGEPAIWYNLGLLALRQNEFDLAKERLDKAIALAPENNDILRLIGVMELTKGNMAEGTDYLERAVAQNSADFKARFALAQEYVRTGDPEQWARAAALYEQLADDLPENLVVQIEKARLASQIDNLEGVQEAAEVIALAASGWSEAIQEPFNLLKQAIDDQDITKARVQAGFLRNMLLSTYNFRQDLLTVQTPTEEVGDLVTAFILLPAPQSQVAPPDGSLAYATNLPEIDASLNIAGFETTVLDGDGEISEIYWTSEMLSIQRQSFNLAVEDIGYLDHNYDFLVDVAAVGPDGFQLFEQDSTGGFSPISIEVTSGAFDTSQPFNRVWVADIDLEGDLDLLLGSSAGLNILRNNGDGTFASLDLFGDVQHPAGFTWGDFDGDGDPDPAFLGSEGEVYLYANERMGNYIRQIIPPIFGNALAIASADPNADALMDLVVLMDDGSVYTVSNQPTEGWVVRQLTQGAEFQPAPAGKSRLFLADFDNNGAVDLLLAGSQSQVWLQTEQGIFEQATGAAIAGSVASVLDLNADGLLDLAGVDTAGNAASWQGQGSLGYHWQILRPRAGQALGDQRINSFTIGGEVEIRAGMLYQKQPILSPVVHLGLGTHQKTDVARLIWPNGDIQSEFDLAADQSIFTPQRLKGSCPWLFTYDGEKMRFVTDFIWRSPLGLRINAQETAGVMTTEDWVKIKGEELAPRDGYYDIRITAELWETHFFDHVSLLAVDHPMETEIFVDERFAFPPPEMKVNQTALLQPVLKVETDQGEDQTVVVSKRDGAYLDFFGRGAYQGITREHYIDITLDESIMGEPDPVLVAFGWVRPTDSSINVAISQGKQSPPQGLSLEVLTVDGEWRMMRENLGFPAGKTKTVLIDLAGVFTRDTLPKIRLRTNLEVYWDHIAWTTRSDEPYQVKQVPLQSAELKYRGFSKVEAADASSPDLPDYQHLEGTMPRWRDLIGYYTRFGSVDTLLAKVDDRYVIMNAGDEMRFKFEALEPPPAGWQRDFILAGDGWVKDGDYNTAFSKTVIPLPTHASAAYDAPPQGLYADPVYQKHPEDWQTYHTRYVAPDRFLRALTAP